MIRLKKISALLLVGFMSFSSTSLAFGATNTVATDISNAHIIATEFTEGILDFYDTRFETKEMLIQYLGDNGVSVEHQKILIDKLENHQLWDVYDPEKMKLVPEDFHIFDPLNGSDTRYHRFDDGSFLKIEAILNEKVEINDNKNNLEMLRNRISDDKILTEIENTLTNTANSRTVVNYPTHSWFYDYKVSYAVGTMYASMITEFVVMLNGNSYLIPSGFFGADADGFGALGQRPAIEIVRQTEDRNNSRWALANAHWFVNHPINTPWGGITTAGMHYLWLGVGNGTFRVSSMLPY